MKTLMAILLSFIVAQAPVLGRYYYSVPGSAASVVGTYAGVMVPTSDVVVSGTTSVSGSTGAVAGGFGTNSLGLFTLSVPSTGIGTGTVLIFSNAQGMTGTIEALADPTSTTGGIVGVIEATGEVATFSSSDNFGYNYSFNQVTGNAAGGLQASAVNDTSSISPNGIDLTGTANVTFSAAVTDSNGITNYEDTELVTYAVDGYQQSSYATASSTTTSGS